MVFDVGEYGITIQAGKFEVKSAALAVVEYWDSDGNEKQVEATPDNGWEIEVKRDGEGVEWVASHKAAGLAFAVVLNTDGEDMTFKSPLDRFVEKDSCRFKGIHVLPGFVGSREGQGATLVLPYDEGGLCRCEGKTPARTHFPLYFPWPSYGLMAMYGIDFGNGHALAAVIDGGRFDSSLMVSTCRGKNKHYCADAVFALRDFVNDDLPDEDLSIRFGLLEVQPDETGWVAMGRFHRRYNHHVRHLPSLADKMQGNSTLEHSNRSVSIRFRMATKPVPATVLNQTPENQPPVKVFLRFEDVQRLVEEFARQELGPAELCLVGWNYGGHDGAWPQAFPVEESLGGESALRRLIECSHELGFPMSLHDNFYDAYTLADNYDPDTIVIKPDGTQLVGDYWAGGQSHHLCPQCACEKYAAQSMAATAKLGIKGPYYSDVLTEAGLDRCFDPRHRVSRRQCAEWWKRILKHKQDVFGASYSEGSRDWALPELDRTFEIVHADKIAFDFIDERVPVYPVIYHGYLIYNSYRKGINALPGEDYYLTNVAYGGMPLIYFHYRFITPKPGADPTKMQRDFVLGDAQQTQADVASIKKITDDVARYAHLQTEFIDNIIRHDDGLSETVYSDGTSVWVNFSDQPRQTPCGTVVNAKDFAVLAPACAKPPVDPASE